jgi:hypothetical protein
MTDARQPFSEMNTAYELLPNDSPFSEQPASLLKGKKFVYRVVWVTGFLVHGMPLAISVLVTILYYKKPFWFEQTNSISLHIPMMPVQVNIKFYCCIKSGVANSAFYTSLISAQSYS